MFVGWLGRRFRLKASNVRRHAPMISMSSGRRKIKELNATPVNPVLEPGPSVKPEVDYFKITMDGFRGTKIHGQLVRPKREGKFPALLIVQWAGVYALDKWWATLPAGEGFLVLNISAHDLPIDEQPEFYKAQSDGP